MYPVGVFLWVTLQVTTPCPASHQWEDTPTLESFDYSSWTQSIMVLNLESIIKASRGKLVLPQRQCCIITWGWFYLCNNIQWMEMPSNTDLSTLESPLSKKQVSIFFCTLLSDYNIHVRSCIYIYYHRGPRPSDRRLSNRGLSPNSGKVTLLVITMSNIYLKSTPIRTQRATWDSHHLFPFCKFPATYGNNNLIIYTGGKWLFRETSGVFPFRPAKRRTEKRENVHR